MNSQVDDLQLDIKWISVLISNLLNVSRYACCEEDCQYYTIDSVMLLYHIQALHPHLPSYLCQHCRWQDREADDDDDGGDVVEVPFDDLEFHLRCHGDMVKDIPSFFSQLVTLNCLSYSSSSAATAATTTGRSARRRRTWASITRSGSSS